jgi:hypothetical protein
MNRAILVALGTGAIITSAAAISVGTASAPIPEKVTHTELEKARIHTGAREQQRERIEARYRLVRAQCEALRGFQRDTCLVDAHAFKGRALLEAQQPYAQS